MPPPGYSGTPLTKKLGIKELNKVAIVNAPADFDKALGRLPQGVRVTSGLRGKEFDMIVFFATTFGQLRRQLPRLKDKLSYEGALWVSWPKKSSGKSRDLTGNVVRKTGLSGGLVDIKVCAVDETWSGLKFVYRLKDRPGRLKKAR